ncbi:MAG: glycosyltransferase involved in cell wall biosynthesis [Flavobacteriales bacterium]|jgi:glycosyltransferase involved in cell wall biosynthesis
MISVCMITYDHGDFIAEAIEGVILQVSNEPFELVIGEDFSTDDTRRICEEYQQKYPDIIRLLPSIRNWGVMPL